MSSCGPKQVLPTDEQRTEARKRVPCVIVLPVETKVNAEDSITYESAAVLEDGARFMDSVLAEELNGRNNVRLLSNRQLTSLIPQKEESQLSLIKNIGSVLKCDAVLQTTLRTYKQRVGGSYGAETPASASFSMKLISTRDGRVLWTSMFKETQQAFFGNIMSFNQAESRGFKWITVEELLRQGTSEKIAECPYL